jgi:diamine N-acetyltransferase
LLAFPADIGQTLGMSSGTLPDVELQEVTEANWRDLAELQVHPDQKRFVADPTYYLCLCHYGKLWNPLAVCLDGHIVGFCMWAIDPEDASCWLGGLLIDHAWQGKGIGRATVLAVLERLHERCSGHFALSYSPQNTLARSLYASIGFVETGQSEGEELVARYVRPARETPDPICP